MKLHPILKTFAALTISCVLLMLARQVSDSSQKYLRYEGTYKADMAALSYVARANDLRAKMPGRSLESIFATLQPYLPEGFTVRLTDASDRQKRDFWLERSDFVVERTGSPYGRPYLVIPSSGSPLNIAPKKQAGMLREVKAEDRTP